MRHPLAWLALVGFFLLTAARGQADASDDFERKLVDELRAIDPGAVELFVQANQARQRDDRATAARLYGEVFARAPGFIHAERRQCGELIAIGQYGEGLALCRAAAKADPSGPNLGALAQALVSSPARGPLSSSEAADVQKLLARAIELEPTEEYPYLAQCHFAIKQNNLALLETCIQQLERVAPEHAATLYMSWVLAMSKQEWRRAADIIDRGRAVNLPPKMLQSMEHDLDEKRPFWDRWLGTAIGILAGWACVMALLTVAGLVLSRITLRHAEALSTGPSTVWDLFADRAWLEREMTLVVYGRLAMRGIRLAPLPARSGGAA
jgi:hypothetical protein